MTDESIRSLVCIEEGKITCFCKLADWEREQYKCREIYDCPIAVLDVSILPNTRPSDEAKLGLKASEKKFLKGAAELSKSIQKIKQGITSLEKAAAQNKFRL